MTIRPDTAPAGIIIRAIPSNQMQRVWLPGAPTSGTFRLTFDGQTTEPIRYNAFAAEVQAALERLPNIDAGDVSVTVPIQPASAWNITFKGNLSTTDPPLIVGDGTSLAGQQEIAVNTLKNGGPVTNSVFNLAVLPSEDKNIDGFYSYRLTWHSWATGFKKRVSDWIPYGVEPDQLKQRLELLAAEDNLKGNLIVNRTGSWFSGFSYRIEFIGSLGGNPPFQFELLEGNRNEDGSGDQRLAADFAGGNFFEESGIVVGSMTVGSSSPIHEQQVIKRNSSLSDFLFTVGFNGQTTSGLSPNASAAEVAAAANALTSIGGSGGSVAVTGNDGGPWAVTFGGALAGTNVEQLQIAVTALDGNRVGASILQHGSAGRNTVQTIAFQDQPTGGSFTLSFLGQSIQIFNLKSAIVIENALRSLIGGTAANPKVFVTGPLGGPFTARFTDEYVATLPGNVAPLIVADASGLISSKTLPTGAGPRVTSLELVYPLPAPNQKTTWSPVVAGIVDGTFAAGANITARVQFSHSLDHLSGGQIDGELALTIPDSRKGPVPFSYEPGSIDSSYDSALEASLGTKALSYRVAVFSNSVLQSTTPWQTLSFTLAKNPATGPLRVADIHLLRPRDATLAQQPAETTSADIAGTVEGDFSQIGSGQSIRVQFDEFADGTVDGERGVTGEARDFRYLAAPVNAQGDPLLGEFTIAHRLVHVGAAPTNIVTPLTSWQAFDMTLVELPPSLIFFAELGIAPVSQESDENAWVITGQLYGGHPGPTLDIPFDPARGEPIALPAAGVAFAQVEIDIDGNGTADERATTDAQGRLRYTLFGFSPGDDPQTIPVQVRIVERSPRDNAELFGQWEPVPISLSEIFKPLVTSLALDGLLEDGSLALSGITIVGTVDVGHLDPATITVQIDLNVNDDEIVDPLTGQSRGFTVAQEVAVGPDGTFRFSPRNLPEGDGTPGQQVLLQARASRWLADEENSATTHRPVYGDSLVMPPFTVYPPTIPTITLSLDAATSATLISGSIAEAATLSGVEIQFQYDSEIVNIQGYATTNADGTFVFDASGLPAGSHSIRARAAVWNENRQEFVTSPWSAVDGTVGSLSFVLPDTANAAPTITLDLRNQTGGTNQNHPVTSDATLTGRVNNDGSAAYFAVQIDIFQGTSLVTSGTTSTDSGGAFVFTPGALAMGGTYTAKVRTSEWDAVHRLRLYSGWESFAFELQPAANSPPTLATLALLSPTGPSSGETANATLSGQVTDDRSNAHLTVEFDHNGDGTMDGTTRTDANGNFQYQPTGLMYSTTSAPTTIRARAVEWDASSGTYLGRANWTTSGASLTFVYHPPLSIAPTLVDLAAGVPLAGADPTRPSLQGRVTSEFSNHGIAIDFDYSDSNGQFAGATDQTGTTDASGQFVIQPQGLAFGGGLKYRTRQLNPATHQVLTSGWLSWSAFQYAMISKNAPAIATLQLLHATNPAENATVDPTVHGTLGQGGLSQFVVVQFTRGADFTTIDGQATVGSDLSFTYMPSGLSPGQITFRARTKDVDHNGTVVYGPTFTMPTFTLESSVDQNPAVLSLELDQTSGADPADALHPENVIVNDPGIHGQLANVGVPSSVQFDVNSDGQADATASVSGSAFEFTPEYATAGLKTIRVRQVVGSGPTARYSEWSSLSFVFTQSANPTTDAAALALAPLAIQINAGTATLGGYAARVREADTVHQQAIWQAASGYETAVGTAISTRNIAVDAARQAYENAVAGANDSYTSAMITAADNLAGDLASYLGNTASFAFQPFAWPAAPPTNRFEIPADSAQPLPPVPSPQYIGPSLDWQLDPVYRAFRATSDAALYAATRGIETQFAAAKRSAQDAYDQHVLEAKTTYQQSIAAALLDYQKNLADEQYKDDTNEARPDLEEANKAYRDELQAIQDETWEAYREYWQAYVDATEAAQNELNGAVIAAQATYDDEQAEAQEAFDDAPKGTPEEQHAAQLALEEALFHAGQKKAKTEADARRKYDEVLIEASADLPYDDWLSLTTRTATAAENWEKAVAADRQWFAVHHTSAAAEEFELAKAQAARTRDETIANREQERAQLVANAQMQRAHDLAVATAQQWKDEIAARRDAFATWHTHMGTAWSAYQLAIVQNEYNAIWGSGSTPGRAANYLQNADITEGYTANPTLSNLAGGRKLAFELAAAARQRASDQAEADFVRAAALIDAQSGAATAAAAAEQNQANRDAENRAAHTIEVVNIQLDQAETSEPAHQERMNAASQAFYQATTDRLDATQFLKSDDPNDPAYNGYEFIDNSESISITAALQHTLIDLQSPWRSRWGDYANKINDAGARLADGLRFSQRLADANQADGLAIRDKAIALAEKNYAVENVKDNGIRSKSEAAAQVAYATVYVAAGGLLGADNAALLAAQQIADATSQQAFENGVVDSFVAVVTAWNTATGTRWSQYQRQLALAEQTRVHAQGEAHVASVTTVANQDAALAAAVAGYDNAEVLAIASLENDRATNIAQHNDDFARDQGQAQLDFAYSLADAEAQNRKNVSGDTVEFTDDRAEFDRREANQLRIAEAAYAEAYAAAAAKYQHSIIDAWANCATGGSCQEAYEEAYEEAADVFHEDVQAAVEDLNDAKAAARLARISYDGVLGQEQSVAVAANAVALATELGPHEMTLAAKTRQYSDALAAALAGEDFAYALSVASWSNGRDADLAWKQYERDDIVTATELTRQVQDSDIASAYREAVAAARGNYEYQQYQDFASQLTALAQGPLSTPLVVYQTADAVQDAVEADQRRLADATYQHNVSVAQHEAIVRSTAAAGDLAATQHYRDYLYAFDASQASWTRDSSLALAAYNLAVGSAWADSAQAESQTKAELDYEQERLAAAARLEQKLLMANASLTAAAAAAYEDWYERLAEESQQQGGAQLPWPAGMGGGGIGGWNGPFGVDLGFGGFDGYVCGIYTSVGVDSGDVPMCHEAGYGYYDPDPAWTDAFHTRQIHEDFREQMQPAYDDFARDQRSAQETYVTDIGDAQIKRVTALGSAEVTLATSRSAAAFAFTRDTGTAENKFATDTRTYASQRRTPIATQMKASAIEQADAARDRVIAVEQANVTRVGQIGSAAIEAAKQRATAEAAYHLSQAQALATRLAGEVTAAGAGATLEQKYQSAYASAQVAWIAAMTQPYKLSEESRARNDEYFESYMQATGWKQREGARADAEYLFTLNVAPLEAARWSGDDLLPVAYATSAEAAANSRELSHVSAAGALEVKHAKAAADRAKYDAEDDRQFRLDSLDQARQESLYYGYVPWDSAAREQHLQELADNRLGAAKAEHKAQFEFQQSETSFRKTYSQAIADLDRTSAGPAVNAANAAIATAPFQLALDAAYAQAEQNYWLAQTSAHSYRDHANLGLWTGQEAANLTAVQAIDTALASENLPWTDYLVAQAQAHKNWWGLAGQPNSGASAYQQWLSDRSAVQMTWQGKINVAHATESLAIRTAKRDQTVAAANSSKTLAVATSNAAYDAATNLQTGVLIAAQTYANNLALAQQAKADALAQAERDFDVYHDSAALTSATEQANSSYLTKRSTYEQAYASAAAGAEATRLGLEATGERSFGDGLSLLAQGTANRVSEARYDYAESSSRQSARLTADTALFDKSYWLSRSSSLLAMAQTLATSAESPWSTYYAASLDALNDWTLSVAPAQETQQVALANAQAGLNSDGTPSSGGEIATASALQGYHVAVAAADYSLGLELSDAAADVTSAEGSLASAQGAGGIFAALLPSLVAALAGDYAIASAAGADYLLSWLAVPGTSDSGTTVQDPTDPATGVSHSSVVSASGLSDGYWDLDEQAAVVEQAIPQNLRAVAKVASATSGTTPAPPSSKNVMNLVPPLLQPDDHARNTTSTRLTLDASNVPEQNLRTLIRSTEAQEHLEIIDRDVAGTVRLISVQVRHTDGTEKIYVFQYYSPGSSPVELEHLPKPHPIRRGWEDNVADWLYGIPQRIWHGLTSPDCWQLIAGPFDAKIGHEGAAKRVFDVYEAAADAHSRDLAKLVPVLGATLHFKDGEWGDGIVSVIGDGAHFAGALAKGLQIGKFAQAANASRKAAVGLEISIAGIRGVQGLIAFGEDPAKAGTYFLEALMRVYGAKLLARTRTTPVNNLPLGKDLQVGEYTTTIKWGIHEVKARPYGPGYWGQRMKQTNARVDAFELKVNPNGESFFLDAVTKV